MDTDTNTRTLFLLRHAKSSWRDPALSDFDRPLNKRGYKARDVMASYMESRGYQPAMLICSPAKRAIMTLDAIRPVLHQDCLVVIDDNLYMADPKGLAHRIEQVGNDVHSVMLVGHNPGLHMLALALAAPSGGAAYERLRMKYPTAALCVLQNNRPAWQPLTRESYRLLGFALPRELASV